MMLYDVFYRDSAFDSARALPEPSIGIKYAKNVNWDGHVLTPVRLRNGTLVWGGEIVTCELHAPRGFSLTGPGSGPEVNRILNSLAAVVSSKHLYAWGAAARVTMLADEVDSNTRIVAANVGWFLRQTQEK